MSQNEEIQGDGYRVSEAAAPRRHGLRYRGLVAVLSLVMLSGVAGGIGGTVATASWLTGQPAAATAIMAQPVSYESVTLTNVAGAVYKEVGPATVQINVVSQPYRRMTVQGTGSGIVVDDSGLILTCNHVIDGATSITVAFSNGQERTAQVVRTDAANDLAVLKVDLPAGVPVATLGDSDEVEVGETAIAIGAPFDLAETVTQGIISAVDRDWQPSSQESYKDLIQTDAPVNPGNSGGPLLNDRAEVIGIVSMIDSPVSGSVGVGFAIPVNAAKSLLVGSV